MLRLTESVYLRMVGHAFDGLPDEACGLMGGRSGPLSGRQGRAAPSDVTVFVPCRNADASSRTYSIAVDGWQKADEEIDAKGLDVVGVMHSHTHTDAYPSPTDVERAANPLLAGWHYVIVSLKDGEPVLRSFLIEDGNIAEEEVVLLGR
jgi:[CysO sulfur-carrier protein]-S-L-cysteine hydrolase